jgi:hypothetical protein
MHNLRRKDDNHESREAWLNESRRGRARTIFIAVLCAGLVSLFISRAAEVANDNAQVNRSRINCQFQQQDLRDRAIYLDSQADSVLGNKAKRIPAANFHVPPFSKFADFKKLLLTQAKTNRQRAAATRARIEPCEKVFPKRSLIPFVE